MAGIIVEAVVRGDDSPLQTAMSERESVTLELRSCAAGGGTVAPYARVHGPPAAIEGLASSFEAEPAIASYQRLNGDRGDGGDGGDDEDRQRSYRVEWVDDRSVVGRLAHREGSVLMARLETDGWHVRLLFPTHEDLSDAYERWGAEEWSFRLVRLVSCEEETPDTGTLGSTDAQRQAMERAVERGYYRIPRRVTIGELADELDISHQALSERLRRANRNLITDVVFDPDDAEVRAPEATGSNG